MAQNIERKIFDRQGFLTSEGKSFLNDGFVQELKRIFATSTNPNDISIISGLLKGVVSEQANTYRSHAFHAFPKQDEITPTIVSNTITKSKVDQNLELLTAKLMAK